MAKTMVLALILLLLAPTSYATPVDVVATDGFIATGIFEEVLISISGSDFSLTALPPGPGIFCQCTVGIIELGDPVNFSAIAGFDSRQGAMLVFEGTPYRISGRLDIESPTITSAL